MDENFITTEQLAEKAVLVGVHTGRISDGLNDSTEETLNELARLADTAGAEVVGVLMQNRATIDSATYIGEGKLEELKNACLTLGANLVIFDNELSPMQIRNIEKAVDIRVIDRSSLILDIFAARAHTKEGKIQVELAQLKYTLPRLSGMGVSLSRLGAGIGTRGPGESKLETDRRHIRRKIEHLNAELKEIRKHRALIRERREKENFFMIALVGYTNAGKSSLLNALTDADVFVEDKLFATLDPTVRKLTLEDGRIVMLVDTVGFIQKLPHHLIAAFKSTLEETVFADLLIHVVDSSDPNLMTQIEVVNQILSDLDAADKPTVMAYNKIDLVDKSELLARNASDADRFVEISVKTGEGLAKLVSIIDELAPDKKFKVELLIPYNKGAVLSSLHSSQAILNEQYAENGTLVSALVDSKTYSQVKDYIVDEVILEHVQAKPS